MAPDPPVTCSQARSLPDVGTGSPIWGLAAGLRPPPWGVDSLLSPAPTHCHPEHHRGLGVTGSRDPGLVLERGTGPLLSGRPLGLPSPGRWRESGPSACDCHQHVTSAARQGVAAPRSGKTVPDSDPPGSRPLRPAASRLCASPGVAGPPCRPGGRSSAPAYTSTHRRPSPCRALGSVPCLGLRSYVMSFGGQALRAQTLLGSGSKAAPGGHRLPDTPTRGPQCPAGGWR